MPISTKSYQGKTKQFERICPTCHKIIHTSNIKKKYCDNKCKDAYKGIARKLRVERFKTGKRVSLYLPGKYLEIADQIENLSGFLQIALTAAADIMAWDLLNKKDPELYNTGRKLEDHVDAFNERNPHNIMTKKRIDPEWQPNSPSKSELW